MLAHILHGIVQEVEIFDTVSSEAIITTAEESKVIEIAVCNPEIVDTHIWDVTVRISRDVKSVTISM